MKWKNLISSNLKVQKKKIMMKKKQKKQMKKVKKIRKSIHILKQQKNYLRTQTKSQQIKSKTHYLQMPMQQKNKQKQQQVNKPYLFSQNTVIRLLQNSQTVQGILIKSILDHMIQKQTIQVRIRKNQHQMNIILYPQTEQYMYLQKKEIIKRLLLKQFLQVIGCMNPLCLILLQIFNFLRIMPQRKYLIFGKLMFNIEFFVKPEKNQSMILLLQNQLLHNIQCPLINICMKFRTLRLFLIVFLKIELGNRRNLRLTRKKLDKRLVEYMNKQLKILFTQLKLYVKKQIKEPKLKISLRWRKLDLVNR
ncbi:hypothetical protein IMG5_063450 [Ichthyophthirius multifiliis]|uniref:Uncharacterized protein n=1 Tax=Ichthyophthirius multifiliis TaxID=5932 RepID=G0QP26_ICHMU|nr:hypothetical protein IMG5_063450 [Ichthyophthirius multifiliis]EGR33028.1 hypothetical protein IMG5_063450 [Ichthyophthirius multifiliis]|eukprot:XP_004037014.1 hypothetical protein IMG5_063450 [Ichthyophthirius multifiliis]